METALMIASIVGGVVAVTAVCTLVGEFVTDMYTRASWSMFGPPPFTEKFAKALYRELATARREEEKSPAGQVENRPEDEVVVLEERSEQPEDATVRRGHR